MSRPGAPAAADPVPGARGRAAAAHPVPDTRGAPGAIVPVPGARVAAVAAHPFPGALRAARAAVPVPHPRGSAGAAVPVLGAPGASAGAAVPGPGAPRPTAAPDVVPRRNYSPDVEWRFVFDWFWDFSGRNCPCCTYRGWQGRWDLERNTTTGGEQWEFHFGRWEWRWPPAPPRRAPTVTEARALREHDRFGPGNPANSRDRSRSRTRT